MTRTGIENPWRDRDEPEPLSEWIAAGFSEEDAELWRRWRFLIADARAWRAVGVDEGLRAAQWSTAGVRADHVEEWRSVGVDATEAVAWHEFGYQLPQVRDFKQRGLSPADAFSQTQGMMQTGGAVGSSSRAVLRRGPGAMGAPPDHPFYAFMQAGVPPQVMHSYLQRQWFDEDAVAWARENLDAAEAHIWKNLGLKAAEAGRLARHGANPVSTIREWWRAGIPYDEFAEWIGAGLTAQEAAEQRARGITAEQAATLRALRDADGD